VVTISKQFQNNFKTISFIKPAQNPTPPGDENRHIYPYYLIVRFLSLLFEMISKTAWERKK
jgi:hypothetical protein